MLLADLPAKAACMLHKQYNGFLDVPIVLTEGKDILERPYFLPMLILKFLNFIIIYKAYLLAYSSFKIKISYNFDYLKIGVYKIQIFYLRKKSNLKKIMPNWVKSHPI